MPELVTSENTTLQRCWENHSRDLPASVPRALPRSPLLQPHKTNSWGWALSQQLTQPQASKHLPPLHSSSPSFPALAEINSEPGHCPVTHTVSGGHLQQLRASRINKHA